MRYGAKEFPYAQAFANALADEPAFRLWVLKKTKFADVAEGARLLHNEMMAGRSAGTEFWWRSHFNMSCDCPGCKGGKETDLLAIFADSTGSRFALHVEVKHPGDKFKQGGEQAALYRVRAQCWVNKTPPKVLPHSAFETVLLFSDIKRDEYKPHLENFESSITFEEMQRDFSTLSTWVLR